MSDKPIEELMRDEVVAAGGSGRLSEDAPADKEAMQTVMRRIHRKAQARIDAYIAEARTARDKDDWQYTKLKSDFLYNKKKDDLFERRRPSTATKNARKTLDEHVDFMNEAYGLDMEHPEFYEEGDVIHGSGTPIHEIPTERVPQTVRGAGHLMTPEELEEF